MREIKCRIKQIWGEREWVYFELPWNYSEEFSTYLSDATDKETFGFFTGLLDKNGNKIWEGDKVKLYHQGEFVTCEIVWNRLGMWSLKWPDGYINNHYLSPSNLEVIGNIHERD